MTTRPVKLKLAPRSTLKLKAIPRLPASIVGTNGIVVTLTGLVYTIGIDSDTGGFVTLTGIQTLTNKTLTSPTINGGTLTSITSNNATLTTPSITGASPLRIRSQGAGAFDLEFKNTETLTAGRAITFTVTDKDSIVTLNGNANFGGPFAIVSSGTSGLTITGAGGSSTTLNIPAALTLPAVAQGDVWYGSASNVISALAKSSSSTRSLCNTGTSNNPAWDQVALDTGVKNRLPFANLTQGAALTVLANATNGTADFAALAAGTDNQVLRRSGTALAFGAVNLASSNAVTGDLPFANLTQISGYSLAGNTTSSTGDIAGFTIGGLTQKATPAGTDLVLIQDQAASGALKYATVSSVGSSSGVSSIASNTGAFTLSRGITNSTNDIRLASYQLVAYRSTSQSFTSATKTKIQFDTEVFDSASYFDNATNYRYTPLVAGKYDVTVVCSFTGTSASGPVLAMVYKNGTEYAESTNQTAATGGQAICNVLVDMNGSTDYIEGWGRGTATSPSFDGGTAPMFTWISISYAGP